MESLKLIGKSMIKKAFDCTEITKASTLLNDPRTLHKKLNEVVQKHFEVASVEETENVENGNPDEEDIEEYYDEGELHLADDQEYFFEEEEAKI